MKNIILLLFLLPLIFFGCSKEEGEPPIITEETEDFLTSKTEGVAKWKPEDYIFDRYYSLVDTVGIIKVQPTAAVKYAEGSIVSIIWYLNQTKVGNLEIQKQWFPDLQMWISGNKPNLENVNLDFGDKIKTNVSINGVNTTLEATISENKIVTDVLGVSFGMSKAEVEGKERARVEKYTSYLTGASWREYIPNIAVLWYSTNIKDGITLYRFTNDKLTGIGEYITNIEITESLAEYCKKLGLKETPKITESGTLEKAYKWNNGKVEYTLSIIEDAPVLGTASNTCKALGISYKKL